MKTKTMTRKNITLFLDKMTEELAEYRREMFKIDDKIKVLLSRKYSINSMYETLLGEYRTLSEELVNLSDAWPE